MCKRRTNVGRIVLGFVTLVTATIHRGASARFVDDFSYVATLFAMPLHKMVARKEEHMAHIEHHSTLMLMFIDKTMFDGNTCAKQVKQFR